MYGKKLNENKVSMDERGPHHLLAHPQTMLAITHMLDVTTPSYNLHGWNYAMVYNSLILF